MDHFEYQSDLQGVSVELVQVIAIEKDFKDVGFVDVFDRSLFAAVQPEFSKGNARNETLKIEKAERCLVSFIDQVYSL